MSSYNPKIYAKALIDLITREKSSAKTKENIANFLDFLIKNGDVKKVGQIIFLAEKLYYEKTGKRKIILESARKLSKKNILKDFFQDGDVVIEKIDLDLIAGMKVVVNNEKQLDFSLKNKLDNIFK